MLWENIRVQCLSNNQWILDMQSKFWDWNRLISAIQELHGGLYPDFLCAECKEQSYFCDSRITEVWERISDFIQSSDWQEPITVLLNGRLHGIFQFEVLPIMLCQGCLNGTSRDTGINIRGVLEVPQQAQSAPQRTRNPVLQITTKEQEGTFSVITHSVLQ